MAQVKEFSVEEKLASLVTLQKIESKLPADLPLVRADASLVEQAIGNVVGNAIAHTPKETQVAIDAEVTQEGIAVRITDDGPGITADVLPRVFEKFVHARSTTGQFEDAEGIGLGLAIAKGIMEAHGGSIAAGSPVDGSRGTRVTLNFPRRGTPS